MALLQVSLFSQTLKRTVPILAVLPSDKVLSYGKALREDCPCKTLYLLHGLLGNYTDWVSNTNIQRLAEDRNLAVIIEVAAMNNRQKKMGYNAAQELLASLGLVYDAEPEKKSVDW